MNMFSGLNGHEKPNPKEATTQTTILDMGFSIGQKVKFKDPDSGEIKEGGTLVAMGFDEENNPQIAIEMPGSYLFNTVSQEEFLKLNPPTEKEIKDLGNKFSEVMESRETRSGDFI